MDAALLQGIQKGKGLKKVDQSLIKDASGPMIDGQCQCHSLFCSSLSRRNVLSAGKTSRPSGSTNEPSTGRASAPSVPVPQLGGLFAGGMPTLKKTGAPGASTMLSKLTDTSIQC